MTCSAAAIHGGLLFCNPRSSSGKVASKKVRPLGASETTARGRDMLAVLARSGIVLDKRREISIVLAGVSRSGRSTLLQNLCGCPVDDRELVYQPTKWPDIRLLEKNGYKIKIIDSPCLQHDQFQAPLLCKELRGHLDLLLLCIPICPGWAFHKGNPELMESLQLTYGKEVWKHCILIFTFSNVAVCYTRYEDGASQRYISYVMKFRENFQKKLGQMGIQDIRSTTVFNSTASDMSRIMAIPAGLRPDDEIFPFPYPQDRSWVETIFLEIIAKFKHDSSGFDYKHTIICDWKYWAILGVLFIIFCLFLGLLSRPVATTIPIAALLLLLGFGRPARHAAAASADSLRKKKGEDLIHNGQAVAVCASSHSQVLGGGGVQNPPSFHCS